MACSDGRSGTWARPSASSRNPPTPGPVSIPASRAITSALLPDAVGPERRKERTARLIALSDDGVQRWAERHVGATVSVLAEPADARTGLHSGLTGNYVRALAGRGGTGTAQGAHGPLDRPLGRWRAAMGGAARGRDRQRPRGTRRRPDRSPFRPHGQLRPRSCRTRWDRNGARSARPA